MCDTKNGFKMNVVMAAVAGEDAGHLKSLQPSGLGRIMPLNKVRWQETVLVLQNGHDRAKFRQMSGSMMHQYGAVPPSFGVTWHDRVQSVGADQAEFEPKKAQTDALLLENAVLIEQNAVSVRLHGFQTAYAADERIKTGSGGGRGTAQSDPDDV